MQRKGKKRILPEDEGDETENAGIRPKMGPKLMESAIKSHRQNPPNID